MDEKEELSCAAKIKDLQKIKTRNPRTRTFVRWLTLGVAILIEATAGTLYAFGTYSTDLQQKLDYSNVEMSVIVGIGDNGLYLAGVPIGFMADKLGPKVCVVTRFFYFFLLSPFLVRVARGVHGSGARSEWLRPDGIDL